MSEQLRFALLLILVLGIVSIGLNLVIAEAVASRKRR